MYSSKKTNSFNEAVTLPPSGERNDSEKYTDDEILEMASKMMSGFLNMGENDV